MLMYIRRSVSDSRLQGPEPTLGFTWSFSKIIDQVGRSRPIRNSQGNYITNMPNNKTVKVGVFIPSECQLLDMACVDVLATMSREYLSLLPMLPKHIPALAPSMSFFYITAPATASGETTEQHSLGLLQLTAGAKILATHGISHPDVQPGKLDILLVPGPDPGTHWNEDVLGFLKDHAEQRETTDVLSICTGVFLCGAAGVLEGNMVCGPRGLQDVLRKRFPGAEFVGEKYRWFQDGNFWSCGMFCVFFYPPLPPLLCGLGLTLPLPTQIAQG
ncbi:ThiJ/PfpI family protein [Colletotrichum graminicola]|nr:ThiJ/PfpI family protein [Colletotrichum graminicola]